MAGATAIALLLALAGSLAIYLASPNQRWLAVAWPSGPARVGGALLLLAAWPLLRQHLQATVAGFMLATWLMLLFVLLPYLGALRTAAPGKR